ncbi:MAG TPA: AraC family transcriptional regulator, partial [Lachnospiraceae bacterium]|nr:AraC family transcriptional regulator [Lachnospiraceae bacterium]
MYTNIERYACLENLRDKGILGLGMAVSLDYVGKEKCERGHYFGPFIRYCYLIHVVTSGKGTYRVKGRTHELG